MDQFRICWLFSGRRLSRSAVRERSATTHVVYALRVQERPRNYFPCGGTRHIIPVLFFYRGGCLKFCPSSLCKICSFIKFIGGWKKWLSCLAATQSTAIWLHFKTSRDGYCWLWVGSLRPMVSRRDLPNWPTASQFSEKKINKDVLLSRFAPNCIILTPF